MPLNFQIEREKKKNKENPIAEHLKHSAETVCEHPSSEGGAALMSSSLHLTRKCVCRLQTHAHAHIHTLAHTYYTRYWWLLVARKMAKIILKHGGKRFYGTSNRKFKIYAVIKSISRLNCQSCCCLVCTPSPFCSVTRGCCLALSAFLSSSLSLFHCVAVLLFNFSLSLTVMLDYCFHCFCACFLFFIAMKQ